MYVTPAGLIARFGSTEMAQLGAKDGVAVTAALLVLTVEEGDRSEFSEEEIASADAALARLVRMCQDASNDVDLYVGARYALPLATLPPSLERAAADIARFRLFDDHATDEVSKRYSDAVRMLEQIAKGMLSLPSEITPVVVGSPEYSEGGRTFTQDSLRNF